MKNKTQKRPLISAIIGILIALFTIVCCGLLVPLGLFTAAAFLHQWRIPLIILGIATTVISIFFLLKGKEIICVCKVLDVIRKRKLIISLFGIILCVSLVSVFLSGNFFRPSTSDSTGIIRAEWKNSKADSDLVRVVNFLEENIGKEIEFAGEKHTITGRKALSIKIIMLECCTKGEFAEILNNISKIGKVKAFDFSKKEVLAELPADEIPKIAEIWNVERIDFEQKSKDIWLKLIK